MMNFGNYSANLTVQDFNIIRYLNIRPRIDGVLRGAIYLGIEPIRHSRMLLAGIQPIAQF